MNRACGCGGCRPNCGCIAEVWGDYTRRPILLLDGNSPGSCASADVAEVLLLLIRIGKCVSHIMCICVHAHIPYRGWVQPTPQHPHARICPRPEPDPRAPRMLTMGASL